MKNDSKNDSFSLITSGTRLLNSALLESKSFCARNHVFNYCFVTNRTSTVTEQRREEKNMANQKLRKLGYRQDEEVVEEACK